ncbi:MAG: hypothetical protein JNG86_19030 [Verrucomicrobiaceae bacterium]|nr:hypothetical protein [Verrucomicrobiaceae bacterium]
MIPLLPRLLPLLISALLTTVCLAHPLPEIPVDTDFDGKGGCTLRIEIDPRSFEEDPNTAPSLTNADLALLNAAGRDELKKKAAAYIARVVAWNFDPTGAFKPVFNFTFTSHENVELKNPEDVVVLTGTWSGPVPAGASGYSMEATPAGTLSVVIHHTARGEKVERFQVLFPGEKSYVLDLRTYLPRTAAPAPITAP